MKKICLFLLLLSMATISIAPSNAKAWLGDAYENENVAFQTIMQEMDDELAIEFEQYSYSKAATYSTSEQLNGYVFDFLLDNEQSGFVLMIKVDYNNRICYEVTEIFIDCESPFKNNSGLNIYPTYCEYITKIGNLYYNLRDNSPLSEEAVMALDELGFGFLGGTASNSWTETVSYATNGKTIQTDKIAAGLPSYTAGPQNGSDACANIAGSVVIGYWDMFKSNLIANYDTATIYNGLYYWKSSDSNTQNVVNTLYSLMGTNQGGQSGTTIAGFKTGILSYANSYGGYSATFNSTMSFGSYSISKMLTEFASGNPVVLFMTPNFNFLPSITTSGTTDTITQIDYTGTHTMVAYGRQIYTYRNASNVVIKTITLLQVSGCMSGCGRGYVRLNEGNLSIYDSFSVVIA